MSGWLITLIVYLSISSLVGLIYGVVVSLSGRGQLETGDVWGWVMKTLTGVVIGFFGWPVLLVAGIMVLLGAGKKAI